MSLTVHQFPCLSDNYGFLVRDDATGTIATIDTPDAVTGSIYGHSGAADLLTVAATAYNDGQAPEPYSSRGPSVHYFAPATSHTPGSDAISCGARWA